MNKVCSNRGSELADLLINVRIKATIAYYIQACVAMVTSSESG